MFFEGWLVEEFVFVFAWVSVAIAAGNQIDEGYDARYGLVCMTTV